MKENYLSILQMLEAVIERLHAVCLGSIPLVAQINIFILMFLKTDNGLFQSQSRPSLLHKFRVKRVKWIHHYGALTAGFFSFIIGFQTSLSTASFWSSGGSAMARQVPRVLNNRCCNHKNWAWIQVSYYSCFKKRTFIKVWTSFILEKIHYKIPLEAFLWSYCRRKLESTRQN